MQIMRALRLSLISLGGLATTAAPLFAQEHAAEAAKPGLLTVDGGLMFWTLLVFALIFGVLAKFARLVQGAERGAVTNVSL